MKRLFLMLLLLIATPCFADVVSEIVATDIDNDGEIRLFTQYKVDGVEVESPYPKINGKSVWVTRYNYSKLASMTNTQARNLIINDLRTHGEHLIKRAFKKVTNDSIRTTRLNTLVGRTDTYTTATVRVDTTGDGTPDEIWEVSTDGTKVITPIP